MKFKQPLILSLLLLLLLSNVSAQKTGEGSRVDSLSAAGRLPVWPKEMLQEDFSFLFNTLKEVHPSMYWYESPEKLDQYFLWAYQSITDSMNEGQFRNLLSYAVSKIRCGHTVIKPSLSFSSRMRFNRYPHFPFQVRVWDDTMVVVSSFWKADSSLPRGTQIVSINEKPVPEILAALFEFMSADGFNTTVHEVRLGYTFPQQFKAVFGNMEHFNLKFIDSTGAVSSKTFPAFTQIPSSAKDSASRSTDSTALQQSSDALKNRPKLSRKQYNQMLRNRVRSMNVAYIDTSGNVAQKSLDWSEPLENTIPLLELNSFANGFQLRSFFRKNFKKLNQVRSTKLIIDLRENGGGNLSNYLLLTKYIRQSPFRVADTVVAKTRKSSVWRSFSGSRLNEIYMRISTSKKRGSGYHFSYFERHLFRPKRRFRFDGQVVVLTSGQTFSAATLFVKAVKGQSNVTIVGEETGGGSFGNNGMLIPDLKLPHTAVRVSFPLFRMVLDKQANKGFGVFPDLLVKPSIESIRKGVDRKLDAAYRLMQESKL